MIPHALTAAAVAALFLCTASARAEPVFVNGLVLDGASLDASGGTAVNDGRLGFFSDIHYDRERNEWWALSDRGPGGGTLPYETRVHRFKLDVNPHSGEISNFQVLKTLIFRRGGSPLDGISPAVGAPLGLALDPEGIAVHPETGHLLVSDEYGPSLLEFNRHGQLVRRYPTPTNLLPRDAVTGAVNHASDAGNTAGKRTNRGFEGLAISPDGRTVYAMLQSAMLDEGAGNGTVNRIVAFDTRTARPLVQYAYRMEGSSQGRGISALVALNDREFLVLERNNRGLGVDANLASPNKKVYRIDLTGATDVSALNLATAPAGSYTPVTKSAVPWLDLASSGALAHASLAALGGVSPEKWEGLAIGPRLKDGSHLVLAGTDNDYSVTQNGTGVQFDVYVKALGNGAASRIQCDIGSFNRCSTVNADGSAGSAVPADFDVSGYRLIPGVLHAYKASPADLARLARPRRHGEHGGH
ncbi:esterase-like activity of phytase family protein [Ideonella sp. A 288]|uniref:esterase-like activity of phytase family protein n=1 Tax=Ideonella sp. A 288 TaxID=1962181 RepID=UPI0018FEE801|nr:esterase-like activity of phytase family protein [Ideonella sp. A 288]